MAKNIENFAKDIAYEVSEILLGDDRFKAGNSFLSTIDDNGEKGNICISQVFCINKTPELLPKIGSEYDSPELASDIIPDRDVFCVTAKLVNGTNVRLYQTGLELDAKGYISELVSNQISDRSDYLETPIQKLYALIEAAIEKIEVSQPEGATFDDIHAYLRDKYARNTTRAYLMHVIREMGINSTYPHDIPIPYQSAALYDVDDNRFRYKSPYQKS